MRDSASPSAPPLRPRDAIVPAVILLLLALVVLLQLNQPLFFFFNGAARQLPDGWWSHWTVLGDALVVMTLALPWVGRRPDLVWSVCLAALVVTIMVHVLKPWMAAPRPPALLDPALFHVIGRALRSSAFPSGHTAAAFAFAAVVSVQLRRGWLTALLLVFATGVGLSRMAVGVHWPVDVLAGAAIGWLGACVGVAWAHRWRWGTTPRGQKWLAALLMLGAVVLLWGYDTGYPQAAWMQRVLAVLLLVLALPGFIGIWRRRPVLFEN